MSFPQGRLTLDFETDGLSPFHGARPFMVGLEDEAGQVIIAEPGTKDWELARKLVANPRVTKVSHNAKFELLMCDAIGWKVGGTWDCTMLQAALVDEYRGLSLDSLLLHYFGSSHKNMIKEWLTSNGRWFRSAYGRPPNYSDAPRKLVRKYLELDLDGQVKLDWTHQKAVGDALQKDVYEMERDLLRVVVDIEKRGMRVDLAYCEKALKMLGRMREREADAMADALPGKLAGINPNSHYDIVKALHHFKLDTGEKTKSGLMKASHELLEGLDHPFIASLLRWRTASKVAKTYMEPFMEKSVDGVLHPSFWQLGQAEGIKTGRFSSSNPNFQNLPREELSVGAHTAAVRRAIIPRPGHSFVLADYRQIEAILFFVYADDAEMLRRIGAGQDVYIANAEILFSGAFDSADEDGKKELRRTAKTITLALQYGMGVAKMAKKLGTGYEEARRLKEKFLTKMPSLARFMISAQRDLARNNYVEDFFGKRYNVPMDMAYKACNALCQGGAAGIMKRAMLAVHSELRRLVPGAGIVNVVHDEIIVETPTESAGKVAKILGEVMPYRKFSVPLEIDISIAHKNWADKTPYGPGYRMSSTS